MKNTCVVIALLALSNVLSAQNAISGPYSVDFRITDAENNLLIACGGDAPLEYADDKLTPTRGVVCTAFRDVPLTPAEEKPTECQEDWQGFFILPAKGKGEIYWECIGDTPFSTQNVSFEVGEKVEGEGWVCRREENGLICVNDDGYGFAVNGEHYNLLNE